MNKIPPPITTPPPKKSILAPFGVFLILLGIFAPSPLTQAVQSLQPGSMRSILFLATDLFRLCFFAGAVCVIIGALRDRKLKRQPTKPETTPCDQNPPAKKTDVVVRLCEHIVQKKLKMIVDENQTETIWSNGAVLEVGTSFPAALQEIMSHPNRHHDIPSFVKRLEGDVSPKWRDASVLCSSHGDNFSTIKSLDGKVSAVVDSLYVEYFNQRYPTATIRIRGELEPIIFVVEGGIRAVIMPFKC